MKSLQFLVAGSSESPYKVTFTIEGRNLNAHCTCRASKFSQYCKHRLSLLSGDTRALASDNESDIETLLGWLPGSDVESAIEELNVATAIALDAKKKLIKAKKMVAKAMNS